MRLTDYETKLKSLIKEDRKSPEVYNTLLEFSIAYLKRKSVCGRNEDYEDVAMRLSSDLYIRIQNGEDIIYFLKYFDKNYLKYAKEYYDDYKKSHPITKNAKADTFKYTKEDYQEDLYMYLSNINLVLDGLMANSIYIKGTADYNNVRLSLMLTLLRGQVSPFHITLSQEEYVRQIGVNFNNLLNGDNDGLD